MKRTSIHKDKQNDITAEKQYIGIPASHGICIGPAVVLFSDPISSYATHIPFVEVPIELDRFTAALESSREEFEHIISVARLEAPTMAQILETYLLILMDPVMHQSIRKRIQEGFSAENAINHEFDAQKQFFSIAKDPILHERAVDLEHVSQRLLNGLRNRTIVHNVAEGSIVIGPSITPTDILLFKKAGCKGFATEVGGIASHASIMARSFSIPAVIGIQDIAQTIETGQIIIIDGSQGLLIVNPTPKTLKAFQKKQLDEKQMHEHLLELGAGPAITLDGKEISICANIDRLEDIDEALKNGAQGIGLVRSEYLVLQNGFYPDEQMQYEWYKNVAQKVYPELCTIRAFDIGSDKHVEGLPDEPNPALGVRGIRFLLKRPDIFKTQIRAVLRASHDKNIRFMLPMINGEKEIVMSVNLIEECKQELSQEGYIYDLHLPIGIMIETPVAALSAYSLAKKVDFFSIGTNDLTQYILAADRTNEYVADVYNIFDPVLFTLIKKIVRAAKRAHISVSICGEIAGFPSATQKLIREGITNFSVSPSMIPLLKKRIKESSAKATTRKP